MQVNRECHCGVCTCCRCTRCLLCISCLSFCGQRMSFQVPPGHPVAQLREISPFCGIAYEVSSVDRRWTDDGLEKFIIQVPSRLTHSGLDEIQFRIKSTKTGDCVGLIAKQFPAPVCSCNNNNNLMKMNFKQLLKAGCLRNGAWNVGRIPSKPIKLF